MNLYHSVHDGGWIVPPTHLMLAEGLLEGWIHVWRAELTQDPDQLEQLRSFLSMDEWQRAQRFYFPHHRDRFMASRGILRAILSCYVQIPAAAIQFHYSDRGKPFLAHVPGSICRDLEFNVSHSEDQALYGFTVGCPIGVDLEHLRPVHDLKGLTQRFFAPSEHLQIQSLPPDQQPLAFFQYWTCKEAYLKAIGAGIGQLHHVEIGFDPQANPYLVHGADSHVPLDQWSIRQLDVAPSYTAAVAVPHQGKRVIGYAYSKSLLKAY